MLFVVFQALIKYFFGKKLKIMQFYKGSIRSRENIELKM